MSSWKGFKPDFRMRVYARHCQHIGNICTYCAEILDTYQIDHVVPRAQGGSNSPCNLVVSCPSCNNKKSDKLLQYFTIDSDVYFRVGLETSAALPTKQEAIKVLFG